MVFLHASKNVYSVFTDNKIVIIARSVLHKYISSLLNFNKLFVSVDMS